MLSIVQLAIGILLTVYGFMVFIMDILKAASGEKVNILLEMLAMSAGIFLLCLRK